MEVLHFNSPEERLKYLKGEFEEIIPIEATKVSDSDTKKPKNVKKSQKSAKKSKKEDE